MSDLVIAPVKTSRQKKEFIQFPWTLYKGDPYWVPPLRDTIKEMVNFVHHPFYDRNTIQTFLAYRNGEVVGRIGAIVNQGHIAQYNDRRGFWGFFDCRDDQEAANGLFDAARQWLADQDIHAIRGPANPSLNYEVGLLIEGFDSTPTFMMTYNPPYYQRLVENYGFKKIQDMYAFWGHIDMLPQIGQKLKPICEQIVERYNVKLRTIDTKHFRADVETFLSIYNRSLVNTWGFVPMSPGEIKSLAAGLRYLIVPEMTVAAEVDGQIVGASFGLPDYNPRIKEIDGRLFPFGFIHLLRNPKGIKRVRLISTNVVPEWQRYGLGMVLMHGLVPKAIEWGLQEGEFSWVLESNRLSYGALKKGGAKISKTYRMYDLDEPLGGDPRPTIGAKSAASSDMKTALVQLLPVEIREVRDAADLDRFVQLPWRIYQNDPNWVPPLIAEVKEFVNRQKHPFYKHGDAALFIAVRNGQTIGRIMASDDPLCNKQHGENVGCFGMFECENDLEASGKLLDAAAKWAAAHGRKSLRGPIDYSVNYPCGLLVEGFDWPPRILMNHGRRYYAGLLEAWGLAKAKDLYAWWFTDQNDLMAKWKPVADRLSERGRITVRPFRENDFDAEVQRCREIYNAAMSDHWASVALTDAEFTYLASQLRKIGIADQVLLAEVDGRPIGVSITLPDMNEAIRPLNGRLTRYGLPIGLLQLMRRKRHVTTARMLVLDILKEYRRRGAAEMLILRTLEYGKNALHYTGAELGWTFEDNTMVNRAIESVGAKKYKTYRIFEKGLK